MSEKNEKKLNDSNKANLNWYYKHPDCPFTDDYFGGTNKHFFTNAIRPTNRGVSLDFSFLLDRRLDMTYTFDNVFLEITDTEDKKKTQIVNLGDVGFDEMVRFSATMIMVLAPQLLDKKEFKKLVNQK